MTPRSRRTGRTNLTNRSNRLRPKTHAPARFKALAPGPAWLAVGGAIMLTVALGASLQLISASPAGALSHQRTVPDPGSQPADAVTRLEVVDQSTFVAADGALWLELVVNADPGNTVSIADYTVSVTVYGLLGSEAEVDEPLSQPLNRLQPIPLGDLPTGDPGRYRLEVPVRSGAQFDDRDRILLPKPGVYPVAIELRSPEGPVASIRTHLVRLPQVSNENAPAQAPVPVAIVLSVSTAEGLTVDDVRRLLVAHPTIPVTVILQEGVENQLRADPALAAGFTEALAGRPVLAVPSIDLDPSALAEIGRADLYATATAAAREGLEGLGLTIPDGVALMDAPLTEAGIAVLGGLGIRSVLDTESRVDGGGRLSTPGRRLQVIRVDRELSAMLGGGADGPHRANRVLARLTMRGLVDDAQVVLGGSALGVDPGPSIEAFLRALSQPGAPQPVLVSQAASGPPIRVAERPDQDLMPIADLLAKVLAKVATYDGFFDDGGSTPEYYRRQILSSLTRQRNPRDRHRALDLLSSQLDDDMSVIELHDGQPVTMAARSAPIPIIVENRAGGPRAVMLRFDSDKVVATEDEQLVTVAPGTSSIDVELETRSLGVSPLEVSVWTPDGLTLLAKTRFEIRSTAVPGMGLLLTGGAVGLLGAWWILDARRRRIESAGLSDRNDAEGFEG